MAHQPLPPHLNSFSPDEVDELLRVTLHGGFPHETQQRLLATIANWAELVRLADKIDAPMKGGCCDGRTMLNMVTHEVFCDAGHLEMRDLLMQMHALLQKQHAQRLALLPAMFDCGCSRYKVGNGRCDVYGPDGSLREESPAGGLGTWRPPVELPLLGVKSPMVTASEAATLARVLQQLDPKEDLIGVLLKHGVQDGGALAAKLEYFAENHGGDDGGA